MSEARSSEDAAIVAFACTWEPYGGADASEIFICFGLTVEDYRARLRSALTESAVAVTLDTRVHQRLLHYAAA